MINYFSKIIPLDGICMELDGISNNVNQTKIYLQNILKKYNNITFIGASSGGYAALFGSLLNVDKVVSFIPQTNLNVIKRKI